MMGHTNFVVVWFDDTSKDCGRLGGSIMGNDFISLVRFGGLKVHYNKRNIRCLVMFDKESEMVAVYRHGGPPVIPETDLPEYDPFDDGLDQAVKQ